VRILDLFRSASEPVFSFEFFPPKTDEGRNALLQTIAELRALGPGFVSVTYGAGGSTRDTTIELVTYIKNHLGIEAMAHLTCVGATRAELAAVLDRLQAGGIENVIALRGDPPLGQTDFVVHPNGLAYANELVRMIREQNRPLCVAAACYPETHVEARSPEDDLAHLVDKVEAGADVLISQLFFDNDRFLTFVERARRAGIRTPIVPGIMPVTNVSQIERFTKMCGATIPDSLRARLAPVRDDSEAVAHIGVEHAVAQCTELLQAGVSGIHFYTLNRSRSTRDIVEELVRTSPWRLRKNVL
jgi:methylenetetrahydrofolate reductase (NADPH)